MFENLSDSFKRKAAEVDAADAIKNGDYSLDAVVRRSEELPMTKDQLEANFRNKNWTYDDDA